MKILIVDDNLLQAQVLQNSLQEIGYEVITAENGMKALSIIVNEGIKCVIADWEMPEMNGITLCRSVRAIKQSGYIYFIVLTNKSRQEDIITGFEAGADDYIVRPYNLAELQFRLRAGERILDLEKKLEEISCLDILTEVRNRRGFNESIRRVHSHSQRYGAPYSVILIDIDHFKKYNDTYGHLQGDTVLRQVALTIKSTIRTSDEVFRYGGEEFIVIGPVQDRNGAFIAAERIRKSVTNLGIVHAGSSLGTLTISCGISIFRNSVQSYETIINEADTALYQAKAAGRNIAKLFDNGN